MVDTIKIRATNTSGQYDEHPCNITVTPAPTGVILWNGDFSTGNFTQYPNDDVNLNNVAYFFVPPAGAPKRLNLPSGKTYSYRSGTWTLNEGEPDQAVLTWNGAEGDGSNINLVRAANAAFSGYPLGETRGTSKYAAKFVAKASVATGGTGVEPRDGDIATRDLDRRRTQLQCIKPIVNVYSPQVHLKTRWYSVSIFNPSNQPAIPNTDWGPTHFGLIKINQRPGGCFAIKRHPASGGWEITTDHDELDQANYPADGELSQWWETCEYNPITDIEDPELLPDFPNAAASKAALSNANLGGWTDFIVQIKFDHNVPGNGFLNVWMRANAGAWIHVLNQLPKMLTRGSRILKRGIGFNFEGTNNGGGVGIDCGIYISKNNVWNLPRDFEVILANIKIGSEIASFNDMVPPVAYTGVNTSTFEGLNVGTLTYSADPVNWDDLSISAYSRHFIVSTPTRSGTRATRSYVSRDDPNNPVGERCEIRWNNPGSLPTTWVTVSGKAVRQSLIDWWWGFSIYVPSTWKVLYPVLNGLPDLNKAEQPIVHQMHRTADNSVKEDGSPGNTVGVLGGPWDDTEGNPWFSLRLGGDSSGVPIWRIRGDYNPNPVSLQKQEQYVNHVAGTAQKGSWTDWVFQCRYDPVVGYLRAWRKDSTTGGAFTQVVNQTGGVGYYDVTPPYLKIGVYHSLWDNVKFTSRVTVDINNTEVRSAELFYDEFRWYFGNDGSIDHVRPR